MSFKLHCQVTSIKSLYLKASDESSIPSLAMNSCLQLSTLDIKGRMQKLSRIVEFSPNLTQLTLEASRLDRDPMFVLEKQPNLLILRLRTNSYLGKKMQVSTNGFPRLKVLQLSKLEGLLKLNIGQGTIPWLMQLQIHKRVNILGFNGLLNLLELNIMGGIYLKVTTMHLHLLIGKLPPWHITRYLHSSIYLDLLNYQFLLLVISS